MNDDMQEYLIPYEYSGIYRVRAKSREEAREMFEAMSDQELAEEAGRWVDDRTFTPEEYAEAINAYLEEPQAA